MSEAAVEALPRFNLVVIGRGCEEGNYCCLSLFSTLDEVKRISSFSSDHARPLDVKVIWYSRVLWSNHRKHWMGWKC